MHIFLSLSLVDSANFPVLGCMAPDADAVFSRSASPQISSSTQCFAQPTDRLGLDIKQNFPLGSLPCKWALILVHLLFFKWFMSLGPGRRRPAGSRWIGDAAAGGSHFSRVFLFSPVSRHFSTSPVIFIICLHEFNDLSPPGFHSFTWMWLIMSKCF